MISKTTLSSNPSPPYRYWGTKPQTTSNSTFQNETFQKPQTTSLNPHLNTRDFFPTANEPTPRFLDNKSHGTKPEIPRSSDTKPLSTTEITLGVGGTLNLPTESQVTAFTQEGNRITITFSETKEGGSNETKVTLPKSELERVLASLSPEQQQTIKDLQNEKPSTGETPNAPNTPNKTETISQLRERAFKEYEEAKAANGGKDPGWHPDELGPGKVVTKPIEFTKLNENTYQAPPELRNS